MLVHSLLHDDNDLLICDDDFLIRDDGSLIHGLLSLQFLIT